MNDSRRHRWIFLLFASSLVVATNEALAESKSAASKRSFAMALARKAKVAAPHPVHAAVVKGRTAHPAYVTRVAHVTHHVARAATVKPAISRAVYGVSPATGVVPPSGYGSGRDAYVETLYPQILARGANQSDVDYWARVLAGGTQASTVAEAIWNSQEHKSLERSGEAPGIPLGTAYRRAYAVGLANCKERLAAEARHHPKD